MNKTYAINQAITFLIQRGYAERVIKAAGYDGTRLTFRAAIWGSVFGVLNGGSIADGNDRAAVALSRAYLETLDAAYVEGGGDLPVDDETAAWARGILDGQLAYLDEMFAGLKDVRKQDVDPTDYANARADGYASSLDQFWSETKARGAGNKMLTFVGDDGKESCPDCQRMKGQRHRASWWINNDMVPGSSKYECGGWNCEHYLEDDEGNQFTI